MLLAVSLFSSCKDDDNVFVPEDMKALGNGDKWYVVDGNSINMIYVPEAIVQESVDIAKDSLKLVVNPSYYIMQTEVTQGLYQSVMGNNPSYEEYIGANLPVNYINLHQCDKFAKALSNKLGVSGSQKFRIPTSREWIIAARGGSRTSTYEYAGSDDVNSVAWYGGNSGGHIHTVGQKAPNQLGLYDMSGNVAEWVNDTRSGIDIALNPTQASGSTYGGDFLSPSSMSSVAGSSTTLTPSNSTVNDTHYTKGVRLVTSAASDTLLSLKEFDAQAGAYKWKLVPEINGNKLLLNVYDNVNIGSMSPKYKINVELVSNKTISSWELYPEDYYVLYANPSNQDIVGTVEDIDNGITYNIKSGIMGVYSGTLDESRGHVNMCMTLVANNDAIVRSLVGARQVTAGDFDLGSVGEIYPELDLANDPSGRTCIFRAKDASDADLATVTAKLTDNAPISEWNFYKAATLKLGTDVTVSVETPDSKTGEFTSGTLEFLTEGMISFNAAGVFDNQIYNVTTINTTGKALKVEEYDVSNVMTATVTVSADESLKCTVDLGVKGVINLTLKKSSASWIFPTDTYRNYEMDVDGNADITNNDTYLSKVVYVSSTNGTEGHMYYGVATFGFNTFNPSLIGWVDGKLMEITGSVQIQ